MQLLRAVDDHKDQTYFLSQLAQPALAHALFPVGGYAKAEVRALAERHRLPTMKRKDSQGICFLGQLDYDAFLRAHLGEAPGEIREHESGALIGEHKGLWFHTIGQRKGLGPHLHNAHAARGPWHVTRKEIGSNVLYASRDYTSKDKPRDCFSVGGLNWVSGAPPETLIGASVTASRSSFATIASLLDLRPTNAQITGMTTSPNQTANMSMVIK